MAHQASVGTRTALALGVVLAATASLLAGTTTTASAYCRTGMTIWNDTQFAKLMGVSPAFPGHMRAGLEGGLAQWNQPGSTLVYDPPRYDGAWLIFAFRGQHAYTPLMGNSPGVALTFAAGGTPAGRHTGGDVYLSDRFTWVNADQDIPNGVADVQTVAVHEVGHFTGLAHPWPGPCADGTPYTVEEQQSVMTTIPTGTRRFLNSDDVDGVTSIY